MKSIRRALVAIFAVMISRHVFHPVHSSFQHRICVNIRGRISPSKVEFSRSSGCGSHRDRTGDTIRRRQHHHHSPSLFTRRRNYLVARDYLTTNISLSIRLAATTTCGNDGSPNYYSDDDDDDDDDDDNGGRGATKATYSTSWQGSTSSSSSSSSSAATTSEEYQSNNINYSFLGSILFAKSISRAVRTLSTQSIVGDNGSSSNNNRSSNNSSKADCETTPNDMIDAAFIRSTSIIDQSVMMSTDYNSPTTYTANNQSTTTGAQSGRLAEHQDKRTYLGNPSVTLTALAHSLWQSTIYPYHDTVIDATCGNGKDCLALAKMLFPGSIDGAKNHHENDISDAYPTENRIANGEQNFDWVATATPNTISTINTHKPKPRLIGIDIQPRAIANTQRSFLSLSSSSSEIYFKHVTLIEQSHENLIDIVSPVLGEDDCRSVGLVCYNLGFLPGAPSAPSTTSKNNNSNYKQCQTQTSTTLHSITDATLLLRVGGLLSIMTYPGSNMEESIVVEHFVEGLAMLTTREEGGWRGYAESIPDYGDGNDSSKINNDDDDDDDENKARVRRMVTHALERVAAEGTKDQTWRAFVHRPLGRRMSPVLITAMKIK